MAWPYCKRLVSLPHCERLNGMDSLIFCEAMMAWPHCERLNGMPSQIYFPPSYQSIIPSTPTYLLPNSSDRSPAFSICLGGGGWCCYHFTLAHLRIHRYFRLSHQSDHLVRHKIPCRSRGSVPPSLWYHLSRSFTSAPLWYP